MAFIVKSGVGQQRIGVDLPGTERGEFGVRGIERLREFLRLNILIELERRLRAFCADLATYDPPKQTLSELQRFAAVHIARLRAELAATTAARGRWVMAGDIAGADGLLYRYSLLIQFDGDEALRQAINDGRCAYVGIAGVR